MVFKFIAAIINTTGLNGIRTHDLCDTGAVLDQMSFGHCLNSVNNSCDELKTEP